MLCPDPRTLGREHARMSTPKPRIRPKAETGGAQGEPPVRDPPVGPEHDPPIGPEHDPPAGPERDPPAGPEQDPPPFTERDSGADRAGTGGVLFHEDDCLR